MVSNLHSSIRGVALASVLLTSCVHAQPVVTPRIVISRPSSGIESGINVPTNASMPATGGVRIHGAQSKETLTVDSYDNMTIFPGFYITHSRGTEASPAVPQNGDRLGILAFGAWDGSAYQRARARVSATANGTWSTTSTPVGLTFWTTATGSATPTARWTVLESGTFWPHADNTYDIGDSITRTRNAYTVGQDISGVQTFSDGSGNVTLENVSGNLTVAGGVSFSNLVQFNGGAHLGSGDSLTCAGACNVGSSSQHVATTWTDALGSSVTISGNYQFAADNTYSVGVTGTRPATVFARAQDISGILTFSDGSGNVTMENVAGSLDFTGGVRFNSLAQFLSGARLGSSQSLTCAGPCNVGSSSQHVATAWIDALVYNGSTGASATISVRKGDDSGSCNITFSVGGYISTTC